MASQRDELKASDILRAMADTFDERNSEYGDNWKMTGELLRVLFPHGLPIHNTAVSFQFYHLFFLIIVKLSRFVISGCKHLDSLHDMAVYCAMCEKILRDENERNSSDG